jgi:hypothetical protein
MTSTTTESIRRPSTKSEHSTIAATMDSFPELPTAEEWAEKFRIGRERNVGAIVAFGKLLNDGKAELFGHGQWLPALKLADIEEREAQRYMRIAANAVLGDPTNSPHLPCAVSTLNFLARLQTETVQDLLASGTIHPRVTEKEIRAAVNGPTQPNPKTWDAPPHIAETVATFFGGATDCNDGRGTKEWRRDDEAVVMMPASTHTNGFHNLLRKGVACFVLGKIGKPPSAVVLFYLGERRDEFTAAFGEMGTIAIGSH